ncbi:hypothetical protein ACFO0N_15550 [Halobium salinum]|uniref:Uncharacterized protein n=1 Tax=Halobium salinum TaxID=1364940 RepID=A0ABD5PEM7_9EURY|nr:hypothetical protein [Halobium salinum]
MSVWLDAARVAAAVNVLLLALLVAVWGRNYLAFRSKHTLGMSLFAVLLAGENAFALYYYLADPTLSVWFDSAVPAVAWRAMLLFHVLETLALGFLTWVTLD